MPLLPAQVYMVLYSIPKIIFKLLEGLSAVGNVFIDKQDVSIERIVSAIHFDGTVITFMH